MATDDLYRCTSAFAYFVKGRPFVVSGGAILKASDAGYKANPGAFETVAAHVDAKASRGRPVVEQATSAPGETRAVSIPKDK